MLQKKDEPNEEMKLMEVEMKKCKTRFAALLTAALFFMAALQPALAEMVKKYETETGFPLLEWVEGELEPDERIAMPDLTITAGDELDLTDPQWIEADESKVSVELAWVRNADGDGFSANAPGVYQVTYVVTPVSGNPAYELHRTITVLPKAEAPMQTETPDAQTDEEENAEATAPEEEEVQSEEPHIEEDVEGKPDAPLESDVTADETQGGTEEIIEDSEAPDIDQGQAPTQEDVVEANDEASPPASEETASLQPTEGASNNETPAPTQQASPTDAPESLNGEELQDENAQPQATETPDVNALPEIDGGEPMPPVEQPAAPPAQPVLGSSRQDEEDGGTDDDNIVLEGPAKLDRGSKIDYPSDLGEYSTRKYRVNGKVAYCLESDKDSPQNGSYAQEILDTNANLCKALYYGYGGPGDITADYFPNRSANVRYIMTHIAASFFYTGSYSKATKGCSASGLDKYGVKQWISYLREMPDPPTPEIQLSAGELSVARIGNGIQITEPLTLQADERNTITLSIPSGVTYHNQDSGEAQTGGTVQIHGGTTFFFSAPLSMTGTWTTEEMKGSIDKIWKVLVIKTGTKTQDMGSYATESYGGSVQFTVEWKSDVRLKAIKVDADDTEHRLAGAVLGVYSDANCTQQLGTMTTDAQGQAESQIPRTYSTVYVKELTAPEGYRLNKTVYTVNLEEGDEITVMIKDEKQSAGLKIIKKGEKLTGANTTTEGVEFLYETYRLPGAIYRVTADSAIYDTEGKLLYQKGDIVADNLVTNEEGEVFLNELPLGRYRVTETQAPAGYILSSESQIAVLEYAGQNAEVAFDEVTFTNERQKVRVYALKRDAKTEQPLQGAEFALTTKDDIVNAAGEILVSAGTILQKAVSNAEGQALFTADLPVGYRYGVQETQAPLGYKINNETYEFAFEADGSGIPVAEFTHDFKNEQIYASLELKKQDLEAGTAQGDASLAGAVYGLYAREDVLHPDGKTGVLFEAGSLVTTMTTDDQGSAFIDSLYPGRYFLKEITPSPGYALDVTEYEVDCTCNEGAQEKIEVVQTVNEQVNKQPFQIIKAAKNQETDAHLIEGAGFSAWLRSELSIKEDGSYDFESAAPVVLGEDGATEIFTDSNGYAKTVPLPYGVYIVRETTIPMNYAPVEDFLVTVSDHLPDTPQVWRVLLDEEFGARLKIVKNDAVTGRTILRSGAEFTLYDLDNEVYVNQTTVYPQPTMHASYRTDESGTLILPEPLRPGRYRITEITAPEGYLLNPDPVDVTIGADEAYQIDPVSGDPVITVMMNDQPAKGQIVIYKTGEVLTGYEDGAFVYESRRLSGVTFEVYGAEDIYTADGQTDEDGNRYLEYAKGALVATLTTDVNGEARTEALPFGSYSVVETRTAEGFVLDGKVHPVSLSYESQEAEVAVQTVTLENVRQRVAISVEKCADDGKTKLPGAVFALYAGADITANGNTLVQAGTCLATAQTNDTGSLVFDIDLPLGKYLVGEITAPKGYLLSEEFQEVDASYRGQETEIIELKAAFEDHPTRIAISKADTTTGVELDGAKLTLLDSKGNVVDSWVSVAGKPHMVEGLTIGETYTLKEEIAPYGYLTANAVQFTVVDTSEVQKVVIKDEVPTGRIIINKRGEFLSSVSPIDQAAGWIGNAFSYVMGSLQDVTFEVYALEDIRHADGVSPDYYAQDELVATIKTDASGIASLGGLPLGKYYVKEAETLNGFVLDAQAREIDLSYRDSSTAEVTYSSDWQNERRKASIRVYKYARETKEPLEGAVFGLFAGEDILAQDVVLLKKDEMIEQRASDEAGELIFQADLPVGFEYYVKEIAPPEGYASDVEIQSFDFSEDGGAATEERSFEFWNDVTKVRISKTDLGGKELEGAKLSLLDSTGKVIESWTSTLEPHYIEMLPVGSYTLHEESAPSGYLVAEDMTFEVKDTGEIQSVVMKDAADIPEEEIPDTPKTGDSQRPVLWLAISMLAMGGVVVGSILLWRRRRR